MEGEQVRVLLVEDDADDYAFTRDLLAEIEGRPFVLDWVSTVDAAREAIAKGAHDVYLLDYRLGPANGLDLLREAIANGLRAPVILLTGMDDRSVDLEAMKAGAADYVIKERLDAGLLERAIRYARERKRSEESLRRMQEELERRVAERTAELARANAVLQEEVAERKRAEEKIKASLREKEVLLREIHHRVKNNLQVISSLLMLQSRHVKDRPALEMFKESQNRVRAMALIHEKLYRSKDLARIDFADYIRNLTAHLFRAYGVAADAITLKVDCADVSLGIDTVIPCALLTHELVSNSLKYAFPGGRGEIEVCLRPVEKDKFKLTVRDNGVGFPEGLDFRTTDSLGLQLVTALADQLEAGVQVSREHGTAFTITFAELRYRERG